MKPGGAVTKIFQQAVQHHRAGRVEKAELAYKQVLRYAPKHSGALCNLGVLRKVAGDPNDAMRYYERALQSNPNDAMALSNCGNLLGDFGRWGDAARACEKATSLNPSMRDAWNNLANAYFNLGRVAAAEIAVRRALALDPNFAEAWNTLGNALYPQGNFDEALRSYRRAFAVDPTYAKAKSNVLFVANNHPDLTQAEIFAEYVRWANEFEPAVISPQALLGNDRNADRRLRVAYLSPDLRHHSMRYFLLPLLENHNRHDFELVLYSDSLVSDEWTKRYREAADKFVQVRTLNDTALHAKIREDGIDVLVDLAGHTANHRLGVFARRAAPIQVSYLGYGYTTGLKNMDYFIADSRFVPTGTDQFFSERVWRLPRVQYVYRPDDACGVAPLPASRKGFITFGCFSRSVRFNHKVVRTWAGILKLLPTSQLRFNTRFLREPETQKILKDAFSSHGIGIERLHFEFESPPWRSYTEDIDIALDPFPHNGGTTTFDALWMGCPVVSLKSHAAIGCFGETILSAIGCPEWVASSEDEYIATAVRLAMQLNELTEIRAGLRARILLSPIGDEHGLATAIEAAFREMWQELVH
jgi:predicted O-linked N-acetylglucosamine transferase (SPINDLY family)